MLLYRKFTPHLPLQFILFTHDELIFESARDAILAIDSKLEETMPQNNENSGEVLDPFWESPLSEKTRFARLFPPSERDNIPQRMKNGQEYWNLLFDFNQTSVISRGNEQWKMEI